MNRLLLCLALPVYLVIGSCSKDSTTAPPQPTVLGLWVGTYSAVNENAQGLYQMYDLKADSTIQTQGEGADGNTYYSSGTYSLSGTTFTATYTTNNFSNQGASETVTGTWNSATGQISGTWVAENNANSGSFSMTKVP